MDEENKKIEENTENINSSEDKLNRQKNKIVKYGVYILILMFSLVARNFSVLNNFNLGDFGSIIPLLLQSVALMGFKWLPIFSVAGLLITVFEEKLGDFANGFLTIVIIVAVVSFGLLLVI